MDPTDEVITVEQALRRYTSDNPQACDTPDGIARWWLQGRHALRLVMRALENLQQQGLLECAPAADGRVRYRRPGTGTGIGTAVPAPTEGTAAPPPRANNRLHHRRNAP